MKNLNSFEINEVSGGRILSPLIIRGIESYTGKKLSKPKQDKIKNFTVTGIFATGVLALLARNYAAPITNSRVCIASVLCLLGVFETPDQMPWPGHLFKQK